jgi:predicted transport protein
MARLGDIKLFKTASGGVEELTGSSVTVEKSLQALMEKHLETFLGVRFLASEYPTGKSHGGRIDTLGLDENGSPVIIEYKRTRDENVINQGLFYLDWLLDHRAEFTMLAMKQLGGDVEAEIDWSSPRLLCIAGDFTKYDMHAVAQINRNISLLRYVRYGEDYLLLELVNAQTTTPGTTSGGLAPKVQYKTVSEYLAHASAALRSLFDEVDAYCMALGDDVQRNTLKVYFAYKRIKNFACVEVHAQSGELLVYVKVDPDDIVLEPGFSRDVRMVGHFGTGDLELRISDAASWAKAKPLIDASYQLS